MPWGLGGGPWWAYNSRDLRRFRRYWQRCFRFPWLPRGWWAFPEYWSEFSPEEERKLLKDELKDLKEEMKIIEERLKELELETKNKEKRKR